jgi:hypothetical protein
MQRIGTESVHTGAHAGARAADRAVAALKCDTLAAGIASKVRARKG